MSNICLLLSCLTLPLSFGLIDLQSKLPLNDTGHTLFEGFIILVIFWLLWLFNRLDQWLYLHSYYSATHKKTGTEDKNAGNLSLVLTENHTWSSSKKSRIEKDHNP